MGKWRANVAYIWARLPPSGLRLPGSERGEGEDARGSSLPASLGKEPFEQRYSIWKYFTPFVIAKTFGKHYNSCIWDSA